MSDYCLPIEAWKNPREGRGFKLPLHCLRCLKQSTVMCSLKNPTNNSLITCLCKNCLCEMINLIDRTILEECRKPRDEI